MFLQLSLIFARDCTNSPWLTVSFTIAAIVIVELQMVFIFIFLQHKYVFESRKYYNKITVGLHTFMALCVYTLRIKMYCMETEEKQV